LQHLLQLDQAALVVGEVHLRETLDVDQARASRDNEVGGFHGSAPRIETPATMRGLASDGKTECGIVPAASAMS
jgi:hypothetical protein